jgi:4-amino-4-deoxy-L-arabinose transferase-like glycosyltransferase
MKQERYLYLILAIAALALLFNLNSWGVLEASEAGYAEISREMFGSGNLLQPTLLNIWHFHKPPITFWLTDLGLELFKVSALGARFVLQLSLILQGV